MKIKLAILGLVLSIFSSGVYAYKIEILEDSYEGINAFYLGKDLTGYVKALRCEDCKEEFIKITPKAEASLDGKIVPLETFVMSGNKPAGVHVNKKTGQLRIIWFSK